MSTTLWWGKDRNRLPAIVSSAVLTLCYRLLRRFERHQPASGPDQEIERRAKLLWQACVASAGGALLGPEVLRELEKPACTVEAGLAAARTGRPFAPSPAPRT